MKYKANKRIFIRVIEREEKSKGKDNEINGFKTKRRKWKKRWEKIKKNNIIKKREIYNFEFKNIEQLPNIYKNIPIQILSKYYLNIYSEVGQFYESSKEDLLTKGPLKSKFYDYIKILYISNKSKINNNIKLYHSLKIEDYEFEKIEKEQKVYTRRFFIF